METINLIGIGRVNAMAAGDLKVGDIVVWNYGEKSEVMEIKVSKSGKTANILMMCSDGKTRWRRLSLLREVGRA